MIKIQHLSKRYNQTDVLSIDTLTIFRGEILGVVGNNGAGKTTLFSLLLDLIKSTTGKVTSNELDVSQTEEWKQYTSAFLDEGFLIGFLTPDEYFEFLGKLKGLSPNKTMEFVRQFEDLFRGEVIGQKKYIRNLSKGNQKKVGLVGSLIGNPEIVIWDEPFSNLDPSTQLRIRTLIKEHSENRTFLISSHDLNHIAEVCTRIIILDEGRVVRDSIRTEASIKELYDYFVNNQ